MHLRPTLVAGIVGMVTAACGGATASPAVSAPAKSPAPCSLISTGIATAALGEPVGPGKPSDIASINGCVWSATGASNGSDVVIVDYADLVSFNASKAAKGQGFTLEEVSGLGDDAFFQTTGPMTILEVRKGSVVISVGVERNGSQRDAEKTVAAAAIANLP